MRSGKIRFLSAMVLLVPINAGCWIQNAPPATEEELNKGLIVLYPGISSLPSDMILWYEAMREEGVEQAIEVISYGPPLDLIGNLQNFERNKAFSVVEAQRIAAYADEYPGRPVTLIGYSGGAAIAVLVAEYLPEGCSIDRVLLFSSGLSAQYDLAPALEHCDHGMMHYYSPIDTLSLFFTNWLGTMDGFNTDPAAAVGFDFESPAFTEWTWTEDMRALGNNGDHTDYLWNEAWLRVYVPPLLPDPYE